MPKPGSKKLNKELIRNFSGKYENGGAYFFIGQQAFDGGMIFE